MESESVQGAESSTGHSSIDVQESTDAKGLVSVTPVPTNEEMAAIMATTSLFTGDQGAQGLPQQEIPRWRFAGRWWSKPLPTRRDRP